MSCRLSVLIVALNEAAGLPLLLADLARAPELVGELLVVDGGSSDGTRRIAALGGARVLSSPAGRGLQLARGVAASSGAWMLLLHADARLPADWPAVVSGAMAQGRRHAWAFRLAIAGPGPGLRLVELLVTLRSRLRSLPYGDQGLLIERSWLAAAGGIKPLPLMEDLELAERLRRRQAIGLLPAALSVSARRWRRLGVLGTSLANARLRLAWRRGVAAEALAARYARGRGGR